MPSQRIQDTVLEVLPLALPWEPAPQPVSLQGDPLGPAAPAGVTLVSLSPRDGGTQLPPGRLRARAGSWAQPRWQRPPAPAAAPRNNPAASQQPETRVMCISFIHLEKPIHLLDIRYNAALPGSGTTHGVLLCSEYQLFQVLMQQSLPQMMQ